MSGSENGDILFLQLTVMFKIIKEEWEENKKYWVPEFYSPIFFKKEKLTGSLFLDKVSFS